VLGRVNTKLAHNRGTAVAGLSTFLACEGKAKFLEVAPRPSRNRCSDETFGNLGLRAVRWDCSTHISSPQNLFSRPGDNAASAPIGNDQMKRPAQDQKVIS